MRSEKSPFVLAVMDPGRGRALIQQMEEEGICVISVRGRDEARRVLGDAPCVPIVLTAERLPDGDWRDILADVVAAGVTAEVVVCTGSLEPMDLCFELLDRGGFGMLSEPYDKEQMTWLINTANSRSRLAN